MLTKLLILFILVPALELILLIQIGQIIGTLPTITLIVATGILGAFLAKRQGARVLASMRTEIQSGQLPADSLFDGALVLVAGAFLMTPGILTDTVGFLCLIPPSRRVIKRIIWSRIQRSIQSGQIHVERSRGTQQQAEPENVIIIDPDDYRQEP